MFNTLKTHKFAAAALMAVTLPMTAAAQSGHFNLIDETKQPGGTLQTGATPAGWLEPAVLNWMSYLPDSKPLNQISIPGTHDTGATHGGLAVQAQSMSIMTQLQSGIRYLDIRTRRTGTTLVIHHGAFYQQLSMDDVLTDATSFLNSHPTETVIMRVKADEYDAESGSETFGTIWASYMSRYGSHFAHYLEFPAKLGSVRGKIVVLRDGAGWVDGTIGYAYADYTKFQIQDSYSVWWMASDPAWGGVSLGHKKDLINAYIVIAGVFDYQWWYLNHLSGSTGMAPEDVARATNQSAYDFMGPYAGPKVVGTLIMDFPGEQLIYRIIKTNFTAAH